MVTVGEASARILRKIQPLDAERVPLERAVCPAVQTYRAASLAAGSRQLPSPYPPTDCPPTWGNTDIMSATTG